MKKNIVAPSYGTVIEVKKVTADNGLQYYHIATFLATWDNHDQFIPYDCICLDMTYTPGKFHLAHMLGKSDKNERWTTVFKAAFGRFVVVQLAGLVARRIINNCHIGSAYKQGAVYGEILLGSRVDITLPTEGITLNVKKGDILKGGQTVIAFYNEAEKLGV